MTPDYDLLIIGGGVNGAGIARDAAGRGMSVLLVEAQDLAGATSSASTKLIHGGLRYLEYFEFNLVRAALKEREVLLGMAPHIIWPLDFVLPYWPSLRPAWMIRLGLYLYDHLGGGLEKLKKASALRLNAHAYGAPLQSAFKKGFRYSDCWVDDSRLVALNAQDAAELGAHILTRTACTGLRVANGQWEAELRDVDTNEMLTRTAGMVVNAAGPWVHSVLEGNNLARDRTPKIRLVKGSHIIVPKIFDGEQAYILQQPDRRIVFAIPYEEKFTLIGTTDVDYTGDPAKPVINDAEKDYLCAAVNRYFKKTVTTGDIIHSYSGVRPLMDDGRGKASEVTRDYHLETELSFGAPLLSVFGGKITTYRRLAEEVVDRLVPHWSRANENPASQMAWTDTVPLPGGDIFNGDFNEFLKEQTERYDWLPAPIVRRYARAYGTRMDRLLEGAVNMNSLGRHFGDDLYQAEIDYLIKTEWAKTADDILWRRSKRGLHISGNTKAQLNDYMITRRQGGRMVS